MVNTEQVDALLRACGADDAEGNCSLATAAERAGVLAAVRANLNGAAPADIAEVFAELRVRFAAAGAEADELARCVPQPADDAPRGARRFHFLTDEELEHQAVPDYLVEGLIVRGSLVLVVGAPGALKSFLALDLLAAIRTGRLFAHRAVRTGAVAYILAEGRGLFSLRLRAFKQQHGIDGALGLAVLPEAVQLTNRTEVSALIDAMGELPALPVATVFDTYARCAVGVDENSAKDTGLAVAGLDRIRAATDTTAVVLHHTPRGEDRERGSAALRAASDTLLHVSVDGDFITVECQRQKDIEATEPLRFRKRVLDLGDGYSSCVLVPLSAAEHRHPPQGVGDLPASVRAVLVALRAVDRQSAVQLGNVTGLAERTLFRALHQAREWNLIDGGGRTPHRITPVGRALFVPE